MSGCAMPSVSARSSNVRRSSPHVNSIPFAWTRSTASSHVIRSLGAERRADVVHLLQGEHERLRVELPGLREVRLLPEVLAPEQRAPPLRADGRDHRRVDLEEPLAAEVFVHGPEDGVADAEDRGHPLGAHPEVADVEEELLAQVLLDRELLRVRDDVELLRADLVAAGGALVLHDRALGGDGGLDERLLRALELLGRDGLPRHRHLEDAGRVTEDDERLAADGARAVDPTLQLDVLTGQRAAEHVRDLGHRRDKPPRIDYRYGEIRGPVPLPVIRAAA